MCDAEYGRVVKAISGFYFVRDKGGTVFRCRARGVLKKMGVQPMVGDWVRFESLGSSDGVLTEVAERKSRLTRPAVANVDQVLLIFSLDEPALSLFQVDKMIAMAELEHLDAALVFTKMDLPGTERIREQVSLIYRPLGYPLFFTDATRNDGAAELTEALRGKVTAFAGQSGVGKSTLLSMLIPDSGALAGDVSEKTGRGRHTTTHVELFSYQDGFVADTPGFSQFDFSGVEPEQIGSLFREYRRWSPQCAFRGCLHELETGCAVLAAVRSGEVVSSRYRNYIQLLDEAKQWKARRY